MKILNVNSYYFSSALYGPMEASMLENNLDILTYVPGYESFPVRKEITTSPPNHVNFSMCYRKNDRLFFHYKHSKIKKDFFRRYDLDNISILHAHSLFSNGFIAYSAFKKYKIPYIVAVRNTDVNLFFKKMPHLRKMGINIMRSASAVIFLSDPYKNECLEKYIPLKYREEISMKSKVVPNGINEFWFENKMTDIKEKNMDSLKLIFVGDGSKRKNLISLINACDLLKKLGHNLELTVVGEFEESFLINNVYNKKYIKFKGYVEKEQLISLYRDNDIFVLPSLLETFGLVYAEALSQGLPVLYTKNQGFDKQFVEGEIGYSIDSLDHEDIAEKILKTKKNYKEISSRVLSSVDKFHWNNIIKIYKEIYASIIEVN